MIKPRVGEGHFTPEATMWWLMPANGSDRKYNHMDTFRVSYGFLRYKDPQFLVFADGVVIRLTDNPGFTTLRVPLTTLTPAITNFRNALTACETGGILATSAKDAARRVVEGHLRGEGAYVQSIAGEDLTLLLSSGFLSTKTTRTRIMLPQPEIVRLDCPRAVSWVCV